MVRDEALRHRLGLVVARVDEREARGAVAVERLEPAVVRHVGRHVGVGARGEGGAEERHPRPAADGHAPDGRGGVADVAERAGAQPPGHAREERRQRLGGGEAPDDAVAVPRRRRPDLVHVDGRLLVRVRLGDRPEHAADAPRRHDGLDADLAHGLLAAPGRPDRRPGVRARREPADPARREAGRTVRPDLARPARRERPADGVGGVRRGEHDDLPQDPVERGEDPRVLDAQRLGERERHAAPGRVQVRVDRVGRDAGACEPPREPADGVVRRNAADRLEQERVVRYDERRPARLGLGDDGRRQVEGHEHARDLGARVADLEADPVEVGLAPGRGPGVEDGGDLADGGHGVGESVSQWIEPGAGRSRTGEATDRPTDPY